MGCETKGNCKDIRGLGIVLPKVAKVVVGILGLRSEYLVVLSHHTQERTWYYVTMLCILGICSMHCCIQILQASDQY